MQMSNVTVAISRTTPVMPEQPECEIGRPLDMMARRSATSISNNSTAHRLGDALEARLAERTDRNLLVLRLLSHGWLRRTMKCAHPAHPAFAQ
jgi:hypothetical protein